MKKPIYDIAEALPLYKLGGDGFAIAKDGSLTVGFRVRLPEVNSLSRGDFSSSDESAIGKNLNPLLQHAIAQLEDGYIFHQQDIFFLDRKEIASADDYLALSSARLYTDHPTLSNVTYFFITQKFISFSGDNFQNESVKRFIECIRRFESSIKEFSPQRMNTDDWLFYLESLFSLDFSSTKGKILKDLSFDTQRFGNLKMTGYSIIGDSAIEDRLRAYYTNQASHPDFRTYNSFVFPLTWGIPCAKIVNNIIYLAGKSTIYGNVKRYASHMGFLSTVYQSSIDKAEEFAEWIETDQFLPVYHHFNAFYVYDPAVSESMESHIRSAFSTMKLRATEMSIDLESVFLGSVGGCASSLEYPLQMYPSFLDEATCFSNLEGSYAQSKNGILLADHFDNPVYVDIITEPYKKSIISNWNMVIVGPSGTGKTVTTNKFICSLITDDNFFFLVDTGGGYKIPCMLLGDKARYIELDPECKNLSCNPFLLDMVDPDQDDEDQYFITEVDALLNLIFVAWDPLKTLTIEHANSRGKLRELITQFYRERFNRQQEYVNFKDFYDFIKRANEKEEIKERFLDVESFLLVMQVFLPGQPYGALFNGSMNLNEYKHLSMICFDLEQIAERSDIFRLVCAILSIMAKRVVYASEHKYKFVWWDEAWRLLSDSTMGEYMKFLFKTIRKKDGGVGIIVQDVPDIIDSQFGPAILSNSGTKIFLSHEGVENQISQYKDDLSLTDAEIAKICSMHKKDFGVFIKQGTVSRLFKNKVSPEEYAVFTSKKSERNLLLKLIEQHEGNVQMAVQAFNEKGFGISPQK